MRLTFKRIRWKNFLSTGNSFTEFVIDSHPKTLMVGKNGHGKSTICEALCFGLFGKSWRNINKPKLVNSVNKRDLLVEVEFSVGSKSYMIRRGIKPNIFELYSDGRLINQTSSPKDYQRYIEQNVLKLNFRSFTQIVILGSGGFVPFMQLPAAARREVIEDLLDIKVFSIMNMLLKDRIGINKQETVEMNYKLELAKEKERLQRDNLKTFQNRKKSETAMYKKQILELESEIARLEKDKENAQKQQDTLYDLIKDSDVNERFEKFKDLQKQVSHRLKANLKAQDFYTKNNSCPTCTQAISEDFKTSVKAKLVATKSELEDTDKQLSGKLDELSIKIDLIKDTTKKINEIRNDIFSIGFELDSKRKRVKFIERQLEESNTGDIPELEKNLAVIVQSIDDRKSDVDKLLSRRDIYSAIGILIKDTGIKAQIIKKYIPIINSMINKYLASMEFFVTFELDEEFSENIRSRHKDDFSYENFSQGEKMRIDLSLLMAWRNIAKRKNSVNTNLLILDEVFDASLDDDGTEAFLKLLNATCMDDHVLVISHRGDSLVDKFDRVIRANKIKNFSILEEVN